MIQTAGLNAVVDETKNPFPHICFGVLQKPFPQLRQPASESWRLLRRGETDQVQQKAYRIIKAPLKNCSLSITYSPACLASPTLPTNNHWKVKASPFCANITFCNRKVRVAKWIRTRARGLTQTWSTDSTCNTWHNLGLTFSCYLSESCRSQTVWW